MKISLEELLANPANAGRIRCADKQIVQKYIRMAARTAAPPIVIDKAGFILDGLHRVAAALEMGLTEIESNDPLAALRTEARKFGGWEPVEVIEAGQ
jgi:hypothetical protein